jgi:hypothetical protein
VVFSINILVFADRELNFLEDINPRVLPLTVPIASEFIDKIDYNSANGNIETNDGENLPKDSNIIKNGISNAQSLDVPIGQKERTGIRFRSVPYRNSNFRKFTENSFFFLCQKE